MNDQKLKSYWNRPGGKFGTLVALAGLGALGLFVLPILTTIVWNTINFGIALVVGGVLVIVGVFVTTRPDAKPVLNSETA